MSSGGSPNASEQKQPLFIVRPFREEDAFSLARYGDNPNIWKFMKDAFPHPYTVADAERWIERANQANPVTHFAIDVEGEAAGAIGFNLREGSQAEMGYWLGEEFWGRGIASAAVQLIVKRIFETTATRIIHARVFEFNPASAKVLFNNGFSIAGWQAGVKNGSHVTEVIFRLERPPAWSSPRLGT